MISDVGYRHCIYLGCRGAMRRVRLQTAKDCYGMLLYSTGGGLRLVRDVHNEDQGAMKAEGQARLEPPRNTGCVSRDLCVCAAGSGLHKV